MAGTSSVRELERVQDIIKDTIVEDQRDARGDQKTHLRAWRFSPEENDPVEVDPLALDGSEGFLWIDLTAYLDADLRELGQRLHLHPAGIRTALAPWRRPGLDAFQNHALASATIVHPDPESRQIRVDELDLFVAPDFVLSAHRQPMPFFEAVLDRASGNPELLCQDSSFLLYIILDELVEHYERITERLEEEIEQMEERALTDTSDKFLADLVKLKRFVFAITRLADQHRTVFAGLLRPDFPFVSGEEVEPYFRDLEQRFAGRMETLLAAREGVNGSFDIYVSSISNRTNHIMKLLTMVSAILLPASVIFGFFGTNFTSMAIFQPWGFYFMMALVVSLILVMLHVFRRNSWL
jgi:magnesium transporter